MPNVNRTSLKGYFNLGDVPTESNFVDLIDSAVNQAEDNLTKEANGPLHIGYGASSDALQKVVEFFRGSVSGTAAWSIGLGDTHGGPGLNFIKGYSRLFINENGLVGIGHVAPTMSLQVSTPSLYSAPAIGGYSLAGGTPRWLYLHVPVVANSHPAIIWDNTRSLRFCVEPSMGSNFRELLRIAPEASNGTGIYFPDIGGGGNDRAWIKYYVRTGEALTLEIGTSDNPDDHIALMPSGNVGIGATNPRSKLDIWGGDLNVTGNSLNGTAIVTTKDGTAYFANNDINNGISIAPNGNVGIGTDTPQAKLQVVRGAIMPSAASRQDDENTGILFPKDPFGPSYKAGDSAYIRYYVRGTTNDENMTLEIGTTNDPDDHIVLRPSGSVGIGVTPNSINKLDVNGDMAIRGNDFRLGYGNTGRGNTGLSRALVKNDGSVLEINFDNDFSGGVKITGLQGGSSRTYKKDIGPFTEADALAIFDALTPVTFRMHNDDDDAPLKIGFIAEDVPDQISTQDKKAIYPFHLIAVLTNVVKSLKMELNELKENMNNERGTKIDQQIS